MASVFFYVAVIHDILWLTVSLLPSTVIEMATSRDSAHNNFGKDGGSSGFKTVNKHLNLYIKLLNLFM